MIQNNKIVLSQYWTSNLSYSQYTEAINNKYCEEKGYIYHVEKDTLKIKENTKDRAVTWYKPKFILEVFETHNPEYILFLDADAIVCDSSFNIQDFISDDFNILCTEDYGPSKLNAGVFIMKNTQWTKNFLQKWWDISDELEGGVDNEKGYYNNGLWHDQTCFGHLMDTLPDIKGNIKLIDNNVLNGREFRNKYIKNFIFHAFSYGLIKNRTLDMAYYQIFGIKPIEGDGDLLSVVEQYSTDKHYEHDYFNLIYNDLFLPISKDVKKFIEIGSYTGQSLELWRDYFKNAIVYGLDINFSNVRLRDEERIVLQNVDQSNKEQLTKFSSEHENVDVILDDGSHTMHDQQISLAILFKTLKSGGIFIIEDLHTSYEARMPEKSWCGWGDANKTITLDMLNNFISTGKIESDYMTSEEIEYLNNNIESVKIYQSRPDWSVTSVIIKK
jgi:hypothetical protein